MNWLPAATCFIAFSIFDQLALLWLRTSVIQDIFSRFSHSPEDPRVMSALLPHCHPLVTYVSQFIDDSNKSSASNTEKERWY